MGIQRISNYRGVLFACTALALITLAVYWPVSQFEFQAYDDQRYVAANPAVAAGLTQNGLAWAFDFHVSNWHPLTWISHMLDVQLFGLNAGAHHLTNLFFHIANGILLFLVLKRMTGALWRSLFVAALFALHPMHVESVAWVAERKDVLSTFFFMLTLCAYSNYAGSKVQRPKSEVEKEVGIERRDTANPRHGHSGLNYSLALLFYTLGLLSKPMIVTLPFVLLLLDYWPLERFRIENQESKTKDLVGLLWEKSPFFLLSIGSSILTFLAQKGGGSVASLQLFSFQSRIANALAAYGDYLSKLVWPSQLAVLYLPPDHWPVWHLVTTGVLVLSITALAVWQAHQRRYFLVGWCWFVGTLVPVIGLVQVGSQYMADRYSYIPFIGCFLCVAWGGWDLMKPLVARASSPAGKVGVSPPANILPVGTPTQLAGEDARATSKTGSEDTGHGDALPPPLGMGVLCGAALLVLAAAAFTACHQLGYWRTPESLFRHCIEVTSDNYVACNNLGAILVNQQRRDEGKRFYQEALRINPRFTDAAINMGTVLALDGDVTNALLYLQRAVQLDPTSGESYGKLALTLAEQGRIPEAVSCYRESLRLNPNQVPACNNLAWILATHPDPQLRNGPEAVRLAEHACQLTGYGQPMLIGTLAAAYAEAGRFSDAILMADRAIMLANTHSQKDLKRKNEELKELYRAGRAFHESPKPSVDHDSGSH